MEKNNQKYKVLIVGAGCAGLMLARELGKNKINTLLVERNKDLLDLAFYTLGTFMNPADFGLSENVIAQKTAIGNISTKNFDHQLKVNGAVLDKKIVHQELINAIDLNFVTIKTDVYIKDFKIDDAGFFTSVIDKNGNTYSAKIFVDATGTAGTLSKKVGLREQHCKLATGVEYNVKYLGDPKSSYLYFGNEFKGGYGWIFPLKNQRAIIGFGTFDKTLIKDLKNRLNQILETPRIKKLVQKDNNLVEGGSIPITPVYEKFVKNNLVCVGDSVSQVNPVVGEGYKFIFEAAIMANKAIVKSIHQNSLEYLVEYEDAWKARFLRNYKRSKKAQQRLSFVSKSDLLSDIAIYFYVKLRSNERNVRSISGEYY